VNWLRFLNGILAGQLKGLLVSHEGLPAGIIIIIIIIIIINRVIIREGNRRQSRIEQ